MGRLGLPARCQLLPFLFLGRGHSPTKIDYRKKRKGTFFWGDSVPQFWHWKDNGCLGPPAKCPFSPNFFGWEGSPTKIDYRKKVPNYSNLSGGPRRDLSHLGTQHPFPLANFVGGSISGLG